MRLRVLVVVLVVVLELGRGLPSSAAAGPSEVAVRYTPPVPGAVVDPWRPPATRFGPGNLGIDLEAAPGEAVVAAADGTVVFAGTIAGTADVVVLHPDGLRTTYAFLASVAVRRGDAVVRGQVLGAAAGPVHFGVRAGDEYLDPARLLDGPPEVHLVPDGAHVVQSEAGERRGLVHFLAGALRVTSAAASWVAGTAGDGAGLGFDLVSWTAAEGWTLAKARFESLLGTAQLIDLYLRQPVELLVAIRRMGAYIAGQRDCTPADRPPPVVADRHIAILVAGFGSDGRDDAVAEIDTRALGYADADVAQFSYAGGQVAGERHLPGLPTTDGYSPSEANGGMTASADKLRALLDRVAAVNPGVPIDVIAHSQGGLVARAALDRRDAGGRPAGAVANLVTLGTPHTGSDLATASAWLSSSSAGIVGVAGAAEVTGLDAFSAAALEMVEGSSFIRGLAGSTPDAGRFTSIASAGDLLVTANHSVVGGAVNVLVPAGPGTSVHDGLPGSAAIGREVALALAGLGPTCRSLWGSIAQVVAQSYAEDAVAGMVGAAGTIADGGISKATRVLPDAGTGGG